MICRMVQGTKRKKRSSANTLRLMNIKQHKMHNPPGRISHRLRCSTVYQYIRLCLSPFYEFVCGRNTKLSNTHKYVVARLGPIVLVDRRLHDSAAHAGGAKRKGLE